MLSSTSGVACQEKELLWTIMCRKEKYATASWEKRKLVDAISKKKGSLAATSENMYQLAMRGLEELVEYMESEIQKRGILTPYIPNLGGSVVINLGENVVLLRHQFIDWTTKMVAAVDYGWSLNVTGAGAADAKANVHSIVKEIAKAWKETLTVMEDAFKLSIKILQSSNDLRCTYEDGWVIFAAWKNDQGIEHRRFTDVKLCFPCYDLQDLQSTSAIEATQKAISQMKQVKSTMEAAALRFRLLMFPPYFISFTDM
jgi:hypothetical protein